jgi:ADP-heptose:LPS heptosyltransferase
MMRVLALVPGGIGDQLLFFPTLESLKAKYPAASIDVVAEPRAIGAYRLTTLVDRVWSFDFKDRNSLADWGNLLGNIREQEYSTVISLGRSWGVGFFLWLTGIPQRIAYAGAGDIWLTKAVPLKTEQYAAEMYHDLLQGLGIKGQCPPIKIQVPKADLDWAVAEQERLGIKETGYILLHGGSSELALQKGINKIYPPEKWAEVLKGLAGSIPLPIVVLQGPADREFVTKLQNLVPVKVTSPSDLGKTAGMIAAANLLLCTDSAPMHLGVAVGTALVALFGPTSAQKLLPQSTKFRAVQSPTNSIADIPPQAIIDCVLGK